MNTHKNKNTGSRFVGDSWKDLFTFSSRVRKGLTVLFTIMMIEGVILMYLHFVPPAVEKYDFSEFEKEVDAFYALPLADRDSSRDLTTAASAVMPVESFNPNNLPDSGWEKLGFSEKQVRSIRNFREKGGTFRSKEDVKKMYVIRKEQYAMLEPFIDLPESKSQPVVRKKKFLLVDLSTADSTELEKLPMVGPFLARKIHTYREKLGGFYSVEQVKEVYGMKDSVYLIILPHLVISDSTNLRRININTAGYEELNRHPYITPQITQIILNYRKQHGAFQQKEDIKKTTLVNDELYRKIAPYLRLE